MAKYTDKLTEKIVLLIEADTYSISEICNILKICRKTFYEWRDTKTEFKDAIEKATERRNEKLLMLARRSLKRKLEGYTLTETRTTYIQDKDDPEKLVLKTQVVKQKEYAPDNHAIKLVLSLKENTVEEKEESTLSIVVNSQEAAENLDMLVKSLKNGEPKDKSALKNAEKRNSPPGYLYRK